MVRVAVVGIGNAGIYLVRGIHSGAKLWHEVVGGLRAGDIEIAGAFDIDANKVGKTVRSVAGAGPEVEVLPSIAFKDEIGRELASRISIRSAEMEEMEREIRRISPDIVLNLISSGQERATLEMAKMASRAGISFVNATPALLVNRDDLVSSFKKSGAVIAGDDLQSQIGGTWLHRVLLMAFRKWGTSVIKSYQLDVGGSLETLNTLDERIREEKKRVKGEAIAMEDSRATVVAGTTDYIPFLNDSRISHFYMEIEGRLGRGSRWMPST